MQINCELSKYHERVVGHWNTVPLRTVNQACWSSGNIWAMHSERWLQFITVLLSSQDLDLWVSTNSNYSMIVTFVHQCIINTVLIKIQNVTPYKSLFII